MDDILPFQSLRAVINFYLTRNPARQKYPNIYEPEKKGSNLYAKDFTLKSPHDIWANITLGLRKILDRVDHEKKTCFSFWYFYPDRRENSIESIAETMRISPWKCRKNIRTVEEMLTKEFIDRELLEFVPTQKYLH